MAQEIIELESARFANSTSVRETFQGKLKQLGGPRMFQVLCLPKGFAFLDLGHEKKSRTDETVSTANLIISSVLFGLVGATIAKIVHNSISESSARTIKDTSLRCCSDNEIMELFHQSRKSFMVPYEDVAEASLEAPSRLDLMFTSSLVHGWLLIKSKKRKLYELQILSVEEMCDIVEALPRHLGDKLKIKAKPSRARGRFVPIK